MAFLTFLLYVTLSYIFPAEIFPALAPYRITFWVGIIGLLFSVVTLVQGGGAPFRSPQVWMLIGFTTAMALSRMLADSWLGAPVMVVQRFAPSLTMFMLTVCALDSLRKLRVAAIWLVVLSFAVLVQGIAAYHFGYNAKMFLLDPNTRGEDITSDASGDQVASHDGEESPDESPEGAAVMRIRGLGGLHDPNDLALGFAVAIPLLGLAWRSGSTIRNLALVLLPAAVLVYGVFLTHSRGGAIAVLSTLMPAFIRRFGKIRALMLVIVLAAGMIAMDVGGGRKFTPADDSASGRITAWTEGMEMFKSHPILGVGYAQFLDHHTLTAHNSFVLCFAETGLVGYFLWLGMILITLYQLHRLQQILDEEPDDDPIHMWANLIQLSLVAFLAGAFFLSRTFIPMLYLLLGLGTSVVLVARQENRSVELPGLPRLASIVFACELASIVVIYTIVKANSVFAV
jgi:hypothetical protein